MRGKRIAAVLLSTAMVFISSGAVMAQNMDQENISDTDISISDENISAKPDELEQSVYTDINTPLYLMSTSDETSGSGTCGDDLVWTYYGGVLRISGTGDMAHYVLTPWYIYRDLITTVIIEKGVTSVSDRMFGACANMTSVIIPEGITTIGYEAFKNCESLTSLTIPDSVSSIEQGAFSGCKSMTGLSLGDSLEVIGYEAFKNCESLTSVIIPDSVTLIEGYAFAGCISLTDVTIGGGVSEIGIYAFESCINLARIAIPDNVISMGYCAFYECTSLSYVNMGSGLTDIARFTFSGCTSLTEVVVGSGVNTIEDEAFSNCTNLTQINISGSVTSISSDAFYNCTSLTDIIVDSENSTYSSQDGVLFNKDMTTLIMCPEGKSGEYTVPESVSMIGLDSFVSAEIYEPFYNCRKLTGITLGSNVTTICGHSFEGCTGLASILIPESVTRIGVYAFYNCTNLTDIIVDSENSTYSSQDGVLFDKDMRTLLMYPEGKTGEYVVPESVTSIGTSITATSYAYLPFTENTNITGVVLGSNVTTICAGAFSYCTNLVDITIPVSTSYIGNRAFYGCSSLMNVYYGGSEIEWADISIMDDNEYLTEASVYYNYSISVGEITVSRYDEEEDIYTDDYDSLLVGDTVIFSVEIITGMDIDFSESEWSCSKTEDGENPISFASSSVLGPYTTDGDKQVYYVSVAATLDLSGDYTVTFHIPGGADADMEISVNRQEAVLVFGTTLRNNDDLCLTDDTVTLYGTLGNGDQDFDIENEIEAVTWENSNPDVAEIISFQATGGQDLLYAGYFVWELEVQALKPGETILTGISESGSSDSFTLAVEPEMVVEAPDYIYSESAFDEQLITCTVTLKKADAAYLKSFMENLSYEITYESEHRTDLTVRDEWYEISDDGCSAVYILDVYTSLQAYVSGTFQNTATITFTSEHGQDVSVKPWLTFTSYLPSVNAWSFSNYESVQGLSEMSKDSWARIYDMNTWTAQKLYDEKKTVITGGQCYGLSLASAFTFLEDPSIHQWADTDTAYGISLSDLSNVSSDYDISLLEYIHALFAYQYSYEGEAKLNNNMNQYEKLMKAVEYFQRYGSNPVLIAVAGGDSESTTTGHALLGYKMEQDETEIRVYVYDCNYPGNNERYITFSLDDKNNVTGWSYSKYTSSLTYHWISFVNDVEELSDLVLSDDVIATEDDLVLIGTDSDRYTILTDLGTSYYSNGWYTDITESGITPVWNFGDISMMETDSMFYAVDMGDITICNDNDADTIIETFIADDESDVTIFADGQSKLELGNKNGQFTISAEPSSVSDAVTVVYTTDNGNTVIEVAGETENKLFISVESGDNEMRVSGCDGGTVTVTYDDVTTSVDLKSESDSYLIDVQENGIVNIETESESASEAESDTLTVRRGNKFYVNYTLKGGNADMFFTYGRDTDEVLIGDWDGDGIDTICVRRGNHYYINNTLESGNAAIDFTFGRVDDEVLSGDWDGDGYDTLCIRRGNHFYINNTLEGGNAAIDFTFGRVDDEVLSGDWDGDSCDTLCIRRGNHYYINNTLEGGNAAIDFTFGRDGDEVYAGTWR